MATDGSTRAVVAALFANLDIAVAKFVGLQTQHLGPEELLVAGKVQLRPDLSFDQVVTAIDAIEARIREAVPIATTIYLEPDVPDAR